MDEAQGSPRLERQAALVASSEELGQAQRRLRAEIERERRLAALLRERVRDASRAPRSDGPNVTRPEPR
jgi:hypothetical protein